MSTGFQVRVKSEFEFEVVFGVQIRVERAGRVDPIRAKVGGEVRWQGETRWAYAWGRRRDTPVSYERR